MEREQLKKFKNIADKILEELGYGNSKEIILDRKEVSVWGYINQNAENHYIILFLYVRSKIFIILISKSYKQKYLKV